MSDAGLLALAATMLLLRLSEAQTAGTYAVTNILSDGYVSALATDKDFIDPWGGLDRRLECTLFHCRAAT